MASREGACPDRGTGGCPGDVGHSAPDHPRHAPTFELQTGPVTDDVASVEADAEGSDPVFAAGKSDGLAGQMIAPTWTQTFGR